MTVAIPRDSETGERALHLAGERLPFAMLPRWLLYHPEVGEGAKFLYCVLHDLVQGRQGPTRPVTRAELAASCGVSPDTIDRRLAQLVCVGAVEKQAQIRAGGQQANVYMVWFTPPEGLHRDAPEAVENRGRNFAAPVGGSANPQVNRSRESAAPPPDGSAEPHARGDRGRTAAAPDREAVEEPEQEPIPPQPPRPAGGPDDLTSTEALPARGKKRTAGTNPRARQTNPRAEADLAEAARVEAEAARRAELERVTEARRAAEHAAQVEAAQLEAEALALSASLPDSMLAGIVDVVRKGMPGPLARSPLAISRAVVAWCRAAAAHGPGPLGEAVAAALAAGLTAGEGPPPAPLDLGAAPAATPALRRRIAQLLNATGGE